MQSRWFLSKFYADTALNMQVPVCSAYGAHYHCPLHPAADGWGLVLMATDTHRQEAAAQDPQVLVLGTPYDPSPLPLQVTDAYQSMGATAGMSLGALLSRLAVAEPRFAHEL